MNCSINSSPSPRLQVAADTLTLVSLPFYENTLQECEPPA